MKLVSAICPTRGRQAFARQALQCFLDQDYSERELIILDDADLPSFPDGIDHPLIRHFVESRRLNIADKRNRCCELASGSVLVHFDSDDWSAPTRISDQVQRLEKSGLSVTGYHSMLFKHEESGQWWRYSDRTGTLGTSLMYTREWWAKNRFFENGRQFIREDRRMVEAAMNAKQIISVDAGELMFARIHDDNSSKKNLGLEYSLAERPHSLAVFA